jgi:hypothetical protein
VASDAQSFNVRVANWMQVMDIMTRDITLHNPSLSSLQSLQKHGARETTKTHFKRLDLVCGTAVVATALSLFAFGAYCIVGVAGDVTRAGGWASLPPVMKIWVGCTGMYSFKLAYWTGTAFSVGSLLCSLLIASRY